MLRNERLQVSNACCLIYLIEISNEEIQEAIDEGNENDKPKKAVKGSKKRKINACGEVPTMSRGETAVESVNDIKKDSIGQSKLRAPILGTKEIASPLAQ